MPDKMFWFSICKMIWLEMSCVCIESKACCIGWSLTRYAVLVRPAVGLSARVRANILLNCATYDPLAIISIIYTNLGRPFPRTSFVQASSLVFIC